MYGARLYRDIELLELLLVTQQELNNHQKGHTLNRRRVSLPPWISFLKVGLFFPRTANSMGSRALIVLDSWLALTTHTSVFPIQTPALKNDVCDEIFLALRKPPIISCSLSSSSGKVMTACSRANSVNETSHNKVRPTWKHNDELEFF